MTVSTDASITGRVGGSITIGCTVTGPEVKKIQWMKYVNNAPVNILIDGLKFSGGSVSTKALTIHSLTNDDARQYQCTASNPGGYYSSVDKATVTVKCAYIFFFNNIRLMNFTEILNIAKMLNEAWLNYKQIPIGWFSIICYTNK